MYINLETLILAAIISSPIVVWGIMDIKQYSKEIEERLESRLDKFDLKIKEKCSSNVIQFRKKA